MAKRRKEKGKEEVRMQSLDYQDMFKEHSLLDQGE